MLVIHYITSKFKPENFVYDTATHKPTAISFNFNGWGGKQTSEQDAGVAAVMAEYCGMPLYTSPLILEGGAIEVNCLILFT
ncbi:Agmatine deiminase [Xenorhabdus mauleonii]|uniref:Agmatine deiminase n=1 Tax=Xenorhabdus mauleonii TaxID=351675 RepID=A0A1I3M486_9GAMM|nr:agmatine deiminase family protein [Xenorhabdus mauleonii]PHM45392.1 Agmatine deiminase [Xenorhabdus mauleonii]SFI91620.1 Porphyromonas-type peptidyl-arginine deiminase [Xenorhabdus mauleonii]